jgi:hypothetical protein
MLPITPSRREFLGTALALPIRVEEPKRLRVAAVFTEFTYRSHAHVILENFLEPYLFNGRVTDPGMDVVSFYADQSPNDDMTPAVAKAYKIPVYKTIDEALCLGGKDLVVDAVLSIGEHGTYPKDALGRVEYPRKRFFDAIVAVMKRSNRFVPLFNDKHLSFRWDWAKEMAETAKSLGIPLMAGSSVPLAQRVPPFDLPKNAEITEAVSTHGGGIESYDFHALEVLESIIEFRKGGETGISQVEFLTGDALWNAAKDGRWPQSLVGTALTLEFGKKPESLTGVPGEKEDPSHAILVTFKDGVRATIFKLGRSASRWNFACLLKGESTPRTTRFNVGPWNNRNLFKALAHAIQYFFRTGKSPYPVERTLLVNGVLDAALRSKAAGKPVKTPELEFGYTAQDFHALREMGDSWKIVTPETPQPPGIDPTGRNLKK